MNFICTWHHDFNIKEKPLGIQETPDEEGTIVFGWFSTKNKETMFLDYSINIAQFKKGLLMLIEKAENFTHNRSQVKSQLCPWKCVEKLESLQCWLNKW